MEDDVGLEALHHLQHPVRLLAVGEHRLDAGEVALLDHLAVDLEEVVLGVVEHHQQPRLDAGDLAAELGADRAAGAGDEDDAVAQVGADPVELDDDRVAAEHVLDLDLAQLLVELDAAAQQLEDGRQGADADLALAAGGDDLGRAACPAPRGSRSRPRRARSRRGSCSISLGRAEHLQAQHPHPPLARVVVDEADRGGAEVGVELQLADDHLAAGAGADHQHLVLGQTRRRGEGRSTISRTARRAPAISIRVSMKSITATERGRLCAKGLATAKTTTRIALATATARTISRKSRPLT